jgi:hypothetical protein
LRRHGAVDRFWSGAISRNTCQQQFACRRVEIPLLAAKIPLLRRTGNLGCNGLIYFIFFTAKRPVAGKIVIFLGKATALAAQSGATENFSIELLQDTAQLSVDRLGHIGHQPDQPQRLPLGLGKARGFVEPGIMQNIDAAFGNANIRSGH